MSLLDAALIEKHAKPVPDVVLHQLQDSAPHDVRNLLSASGARAQSTPAMPLPN